MNYFCILYEVEIKLHSFARGYTILPVAFAERLVFLLSCLGTLFENQLDINVMVYFWILNSIPLICMYEYLYAMTTQSLLL